jgi:type I restriction enzyme M protein
MPPTSSRAQLSSVIKSARDIMRKDACLNGDLDRLPQLSWMLFLKCYDDLERRREDDAIVSHKTYKPVIPAPYRWRDWASDPDKGATGEDLVKFINNDLLPALRDLSGSDERLKIAELFKETYNRMLSGYLFRDVVNLVDGIHFQSKDEIFTLSHLYESMLKEMRDAAGDSGEFYTPRPVIKLFGIEKKPLPFLLGTMNLLLHGIEVPNIRRDNALRNPLNEIGEKERYEVIVTNPPFGGEEEAGIQLNFPEATRASETALLFLQFIMRSLKPGGRCGMVVPNGTLFGDGVSARIKENLLRNFNLHTIVRLPNGVFAPYTSIPTNLLFFDRPGGEGRTTLGEDTPSDTGRTRRSAPTDEIWFYEHILPEGVKNYTKTRPMTFEEFTALIAWWDDRTENEHAWKVHVNDVLKYDEQGNLLSANLDIKNPSRAADLEHLPPAELAESIAEKEYRIAALMDEIKSLLKQ